LLEIGGRHVAQLAGVTFVQRRGNLSQEREARGGDVNFHNASIFGMPRTRDPTLIDELVDHAGDIRRTRNQARGELQSLVPGGVLRLKKSQYVVLLGRQPVFVEQFVFERTETVVSAPNIEERFLFERIEIGSATGRGGSWATHGAIIVVPTIVVQTSVYPAGTPCWPGI
jgi:hypothetical protein